jgi:gamma-glutamyltranspeptidase/glutathione hydrolase
MPAVLQIASMAIDGGLDLESAFHAPRIDVSGEPVVHADRRLAPLVVAALAERFEVRTVAPSVYPNLFACPSAVQRDPASGDALAITDPFQPVAGVAGAAHG